MTLLRWLALAPFVILSACKLHTSSGNQVTGFASDAEATCAGREPGPTRKLWMGLVEGPLGLRLVDRFLSCSGAPIVIDVAEFSREGPEFSFQNSGEWQNLLQKLVDEVTAKGSASRHEVKFFVPTRTKSQALGEFYSQVVGTLEGQPYSDASSSAPKIRWILRGSIVPEFRWNLEINKNIPFPPSMPEDWKGILAGRRKPGKSFVVTLSRPISFQLNSDNTTVTTDLPQSRGKGSTVSRKSGFVLAEILPEFRPKPAQASSTSSSTTTTKNEPEPPLVPCEKNAYEEMRDRLEKVVWGTPFASKLARNFVRRYIDCTQEEFRLSDQDVVNLASEFYLFHPYSQFEQTLQSTLQVARNLSPRQPRLSSAVKFRVFSGSQGGTLGAFFTDFDGLLEVEDPEPQRAEDHLLRWRFLGSVEISDFWDFDKHSNGRRGLAEFRTAFARDFLPGKPFWIRSGRVPVVMEGYEEWKLDYLQCLPWALGVRSESCLQKKILATEPPPAYNHFGDLFSLRVLQQPLEGFMKDVEAARGIATIVTGSPR